MDANARLDRIVVGLRSGLIVMFNLAIEDSNFVANVEEVELGVSVISMMNIVPHQHGPCNKDVQGWILRFIRRVGQLHCPLECLEEDIADQDRHTCLELFEGSCNQLEWGGVHVFHFQQAHHICVPSLLKQEVNQADIEVEETQGTGVLLGHIR